MTRTTADGDIDTTLRRKSFAGALILIGLALVIGAIYLAFVPKAESESGSLPKTIGQIIAFLLGAGANIKGWTDLLKKGDDSPRVQGQYIKHAHQVIYQQSQPAQSAGLTGLNQLRAPPTDFTGRKKELKKLLTNIQTDGAIICGIQGMGGIGKTALALKLADMLAAQYPDGRVFLDLKGVEKQEALTAIDAMKYVLVSFAPTAKLPDEPQQIAAFYRSMLSGKKVLLLWDNVLDKEQVEPLLVKGCLTLITSRQHFTLPGLEPLSLETLAPKDARAFIRKIAHRVKNQDADVIASLCGYLPLAINLWC